MAIKALIELGVPPPGKRGSKLAYQIPAAEFILDSFSKHFASDNADASSVSRYSELQFSESGKLLGCKMLEYFLQKNLVVNHPSGERTFHVLHYLHAGASAEEKEFMAFDQGEPFRYLSGAGGRGQHPQTVRADAIKFTKLKMAFRNVGLAKKQVANICQVLAAILHLGNVEFYQESSRTADAASVSNPHALELAARFLGVPSKSLQEALTFKTKMIRHEVCTILCDTDGATANRDELAKNLYGLLSSWLCEQINSKLSRDDFDAYVGLVDIPGYVNLPARNANSLDQLVVNFANEYLHHWCLHSIFESQRDEYIDEGISQLAPEVSYFDNSESLRLFLNQPGGLIHIIDDQTRRMPKKTNHTMVDAFGKRWGNHPAFKVGPVGRSGFATFTVSHYAGPVTYTSEDLLEKNDEAVNPDFVSLLKGSSAGEAPLRSVSESGPASTPTSSSPGSSSSFIRALFSSNTLKTQMDPRNQRAVVAAQQSIEPTRAPSVRRPNRGGPLRRAGTMRRGAGGDDDEEDDYGDVPGAVSGVGKEGKGSNAICGVMGEFRSAFETLFETFGDTKPWFVFCLRPNESQLPNQVDGRVLKEQVASLGLAEMARKLASDFSVSMTYSEFCQRYADTPSLQAIGMSDAVGGEARQKFSSAKEVMDWDDYQAAAGRVKAFLAYASFRELEDELRVMDPDEMRAHEKRVLADEQGLARQEYIDPYSPEGLLDESSRYNADDNRDVFTEHDPVSHTRNINTGDEATGEARDGDALLAPPDPFNGDVRSLRSDATGAGPASVAESDVYAPSHNMFADLAPTADGGEKAGAGAGADEEVARKMDEGAVAEEVPSTGRRKQWIVLTWMLTFWLPSFVLKAAGLKRPDIRQAWREKLAINMMIWFTCGCAVFVIAVLGRVICPTQHVYNAQEFASHKNPKHAFTSIRGEVFDLTKIAASHRETIPVVPTKQIMRYAGQDATPIFPVQVNALCNGVTGSVSPWVQLTSTNETDSNMQYHDFRSIHTNDARPDWYYEQMWVMRYQGRVGFMGYSKSQVKDFVGDGRIVAIYNDKVYEITDYVNQGDQGVLQAPKGQQVPDGVDAKFLHGSVVALFKSAQGGDITKKLDGLKIDPAIKERQRACLRNLYLIGEVDHRNDAACKFANYILLALSMLMVAVIGFKFLAALQFTSRRTPTDHDKFVICQVPCYTEGDEEIRKTVNSIAAMRYDDKRKLLLIICDGMIVGSGNDRPTPRIVLDVLGANPNVDPEPLSYLSLGEGSKQHNMAKIYSGLYEHLGHVVPYIVVAKCGTSAERGRPGNRGKRDSQLVLMRFFNKVHFGLPMTPMELEMYHQIKNVIGVNPSFYEYLLQVDADTEVDTQCLNHYISFFTNDKKVIGLCGETALNNAKQSFITMLQVYEYYISHYLTKAFESLFASVTCLPGCFSMFRLRTPDTHRPLFISSAVVDEYSENRVDTLHTKNLLHLGEDRYLTTLVLKHFPQYKTQFVSAAKCKTTAPDAWQVLLSQRRRWINSTVHNLFELIWTPGLCGFCCVCSFPFFFFSFFSVLFPTLWFVLRWAATHMRKSTWGCLWPEENQPRESGRESESMDMECVSDDDCGNMGRWSDWLFLSVFCLFFFLHLRSFRCVSSL